MGCIHEDYFSDTDYDDDDDDDDDDEFKKDDESGECILPIPTVVIVPSPPARPARPLRRSTRNRRKPILFMHEYVKYY